jgi:hypothetical protein
LLITNSVFVSEIQNANVALQKLSISGKGDNFSFFNSSGLKNISISKDCSL